jgi:hypothetical protein
MKSRPATRLHSEFMSFPLTAIITPQTSEMIQVSQKKMILGYGRMMMRAGASAAGLDSAGATSPFVMPISR